MTAPAGFALTALLAFATTPAPWPPAALTHLVLAVGALPLILAAMVHFTPVLTRSREAPGWVMRLPLLAMVAASLAVVAMGWQQWFLVGIAAPIAMLAAASLVGWMNRRASRALGAPHPGLRWYQAALGCLLLALTAIVAAWLWPEHGSLLRGVHRHLNLLGFVGLAATGTLQVLLPTVGEYADPMASQRLRFDLKYALLGVLLLVVGATGVSWLTGLGLAAWGWVLGRLLYALRDLWPALLRSGGAPLMLFAAVPGFALALASLLLPGGEVALPLFFALFLFPLVSGALAHLLPLWWWPGQPTPRRQMAQQRLGRHVPLRLAAFWCGGGALLFGETWGLYLITVPLLLLLGQIGWLLCTQGAE
ncbi:MAG: hypothetical protein H7837_07720 [Magnetococcus sp. MYC-9]